MNINEIFPSKYLKAHDLLNDGDLIVTISDFVIEVVGNDQLTSKPVLYFRELPMKGLILNKTNANTIADLYGEDTEDWIGKKITLYSCEVTFDDKTSLGIRVRPNPPVEKPRAREQVRPNEY